LIFLDTNLVSETLKKTPSEAGLAGRSDMSLNFPP
jgi:hypothetical protein